MFPLGPDHEPAHVHARYGEYEAKLAIESIEQLFGLFPSKQANKVKKFIKNNQSILLEMWNTQKIHKLGD